MAEVQEEASGWFGVTACPFAVTSEDGYEPQQPRHPNQLHAVPRHGTDMGRQIGEYVVKNVMQPTIVVGSQ